MDPWGQRQFLFPAGEEEGERERRGFVLQGSSTRPTQSPTIHNCVFCWHGEVSRGRPRSPHLAHPVQLYMCECASVRARRCKICWSGGTDTDSFLFVSRCTPLAPKPPAAAESRPSAPPCRPRRNSRSSSGVTLTVVRMPILRQNGCK